MYQLMNSTKVARVGIDHFRNGMIALIGVLVGLVPTSVIAQRIDMKVLGDTCTEGQNIRLELRMSGSFAAPFDVTVLAVDSTTSGAMDYVLSAIPVRVDPPYGDTVIAIPTVNDDVVEAVERVKFYLRISDPAITADTRVVVLIADNDRARVTIEDAVAYEGQDLVFRVSLDKQVSGGLRIAVEPDLNGLQPEGTWFDRFRFGGRRGLAQVVADTVLLSFDGLKKDTVVRYHVVLDHRMQESPDRIPVTMRRLSGPVDVDVSDTAIGVMIDTSAQKHCPPERFLRSNVAHDLLFFGDGALVSTYETKADLAANTGVGIRWTEHFPDNPKQKFGPWYRVDLEAQVNIASTADSLRAEQDSTYSMVTNGSVFGSSILVPKLSGQSADVRITLYNRQSWGGVVSGLSLRYAGANNYWGRGIAVRDSAGALVGATSKVTQVNMHMLRASLFHEFVNYKQRKHFSAQIRAGVVVNWMRGDLGLRENEADRIAFIGTGERDHTGWELGLAFRLRNLEADVSYTNLHARNDVSVPGLTDGRLVTTIRFVGGFNVALD